MSRKIHTSLFPLALILGLGSGAWQPASAATRNVGASEAYTTIAAAIAAAGDGDVINIVDSTITECGIYINKSVTIQGQGADQTTVQGAAAPLTAGAEVFRVGMLWTVTIKDLTIRYGNAVASYPDDRGGGVYNDYGVLSIQDCVVTDNYSSTYGGGICACGNTTMIRCTISGNTALLGGGGVDISDSNGDRTITITNCTITGNTVTQAGGKGGGIDFLIYPYIVGATLTNCTVAENGVADGVSGNGMYLENAGTFTLNLVNCIISNGTSANFAHISNAPTINRSYTLVRDSTMSAYAGAGNLDSTDPWLVALADNGGPLPTHALALGSPCVDAGTATGAPSTDARGTARPKGAAYDMGAFEAIVPNVTTIAAYNITAAAAYAGGTVTLPSGTLVSRGLCWSTSADPTILDSYTSDPLVVGVQYSQLTGLAPNTLYHFRAYAESEEGASYGADLTFTTAALPSVTTTAISGITATSAASGGAIAAYTVKPVTARGVCWRTVSSPTITDTHTADGTGAGAYASLLTGLIQGTTYYVRAYATTCEGTSYGNELSFTAGTLPTLSTAAVSDITGTSAQSGGDITSDGGYAVAARGVCWDTSTGPTTTDSHTTDGTGTGEFAGFMTGLTQGTLYYVRAYATNAVGTAYGNEVTFTTSDVPTVTSIAASNITAVTAQAGGTVTLSGGTLIARGVCWGTSANPTILDSHTSDVLVEGTQTSLLTGLTPNTLYHFRAYGASDEGVAYGSDLTFTTAALPSVTTTAISSITASTAASGGTIAAYAVKPVTARGVCWGVVSSPTTADAHTTDGTGVGTYASSLTGLLQGTTYYVRAYATTCEGTSYGNELSFTAGTLPTLSTAAVSDITGTSAQSGGDITSDGGYAVTARGVCWDTSTGPTTTDSHTTDGTGTGDFAGFMTGLTQGTLYYVRAYATNSVGTAYGNQVTFTTDNVPTVTSIAASNITAATAQAGGTVTLSGGTLIARGVCWGTSANPTILDSHTSDVLVEGTQTSLLTGLTPNTLYHFRAYGASDEGVAYGSDLTFTTAALPTVTTTAISSITASTAASGGTIAAYAVKPVTARGICWGVVSGPTTADAHTFDGTGVGIYASSLTGLLQGTTYYVRAYATTCEGTSYGNELSFTAGTLPSLSTAAVSDIAGTSAQSGGDIADDGGHAVTARGVCWSTSTTPTTAGSHTTDGTGTGVFTSSMTGLTQGTLYYVRAYATNSVGTAYGNQVTFTTDNVPTVTSIAASNITAATAQAGGTVTLSGGTLIARGVCWGTSANPTILDSHTSDVLVEGTQTSQLTALTPSTLYHFRAYGASEEGVAYGTDLTFTSAALPTVTTTTISSITASTAASGGTIAAYAVKPVTARGVCWSVVASPTVSDAHTSDGTGVGTYVSSLAGLVQGTSYYVRAYATTCEGTSYGNEVSFTPAVLPTLTTVAVSGITTTTAASGGNISSDGGASVTAYGACWSTTTTPTTANSHTTDGTGTGGFSSSLTGLSQGTLYYVRAYATNSVGTAYGDQVTFTTNDVPTISTTAVSYIDPSAAATGGNVTGSGGSAVTARGICWGTTANPTIAGSHTTDGTGTGSFASSITGLTPNTTYHVRAYATNTLGTGYGSDIPFVTAVTTPTVILTGVSGVTSSTAIWAGSVTADGGAAVTARGTCWSTSANPTTADSHSSDGTGTGTFTSSLTGLTFDTTYHVRGYATNSQGTAYSADVTFVCAPTTPTLTTRAASNISATTADSGGDISENGGAAVTACGVCWNTGGSPTIYDNQAGGTVGAGFATSLAGLSQNVLYYVRAYATNSAGTAYGNQVSFSTPCLVPTVTTASVSNIGVTTADCGGAVSSDGGATVTARGVCWGTAANPTTAQSHTTDGTGTGTFTSPITGLAAYTTYHVRAYATNSQGTAYGADVPFTSFPTSVTLTTRAVTSIASNTATGGGDITSDGGPAVTACGVCWNTTGSPTLDDGYASGTVGAGFTAAITGLAPHTLYYVRAYALNAVGVAYGDEVSFTTLGIVPTVTTAAVSGVSATSAGGGGTVISNGGAAVTARGVCWSTSPSPTIADSLTTDGTGTGSFTSALSGLTPGTFYYVRAYATNSEGTAYGSEVAFTTNSVPTVTTTAVSYIDPDAAVSGGEVTSDGGTSVTARGVCWGTTANPTVAGSHTDDGTGTGVFASSITNLTPNTTYHVRAYATNPLGTGYGTDIPFVTAVTVPTVVLTGVSGVTAATATWTGSVTADGGAAVTAKGTCWSASADPTIAGGHTTDGPGTGTFRSSLAGLTFSTVYHVRAYATNAQGTAYSEDVTFATEPAIPTLTTSAAANILAESATSGGDVTSAGGAPITGRGVCWSTSAEPTIDDDRTANGAEAGPFASTMTGLQPGTTYHVRAYATNRAGAGYGQELVFTTAYAPAPVQAPCGAGGSLGTLLTVAAMLSMRRRKPATWDP